MENPPIIVPDLLCEKCKWPLIKNGELKCQRSGHTVQATLGTKNIFCPYCRKPKVLLADKSGSAICPQCKSRTLITKEVNQMAQEAETQETARDMQEQKISRTQELRDWLDNEIKRTAETIKILYGSVSSLGDSQISPRYKTLTPDERDSQVEKDKKTLESSNKLVELLKSARSLDVDIDALEKMGFRVDIIKDTSRHVIIRAVMRLDEYGPIILTTAMPPYECARNLELTIDPYIRSFAMLLGSDDRNVSCHYQLHNISWFYIPMAHYIECWHRPYAESETYLLQVRIRKGDRNGKIFINTSYQPV